MEGADEPSRLPRTLFTMNSTQDMQGFLAGCDADNGGTSTMNLELDHSTEIHPIVRKPTARFFGQMRLQVKPGSKLSRGGYAAFKSKVSAVCIANYQAQSTPNRIGRRCLAIFLKTSNGTGI